MNRKDNEFAAGDVSAIRESPDYRKLVRAVRGMLPFPLIATAFAAIVDLVSGRQEMLGERLPFVFILSSIAISASGVIFVLISLRRIRQKLGESPDLWVSDEIEWLIRDVLGMRPPRQRR